MKKWSYKSLISFIFFFLKSGPKKKLFPIQTFSLPHYEVRKVWNNQTKVRERERERDQKRRN
jgi:hypothetical protein